MCRADFRDRFGSDASTESALTLTWTTKASLADKHGSARLFFKDAKANHLLSRKVDVTLAVEFMIPAAEEVYKRRRFGILLPEVEWLKSRLC